MSWNITLEIKDGKLTHRDGDNGGVEIIGTPPDGLIQINGHTDQWGTSVGLFARGMSLTAKLPAAPQSAAPHSVTPQPAAPGEAAGGAAAAKA